MKLLQIDNGYYAFPKEMKNIEELNKIFNIEGEKYAYKK